MRNILSVEVGPYIPSESFKVRSRSRLSIWNNMESSKIGNWRPRTILFGVVSFGFMPGHCKYWTTGIHRTTLKLQSPEKLWLVQLCIGSGDQTDPAQNYVASMQQVAQQGGMGTSVWAQVVISFTWANFLMCHWGVGWATTEVWLWMFKLVWCLSKSTRTSLSRDVCWKFNVDRQVVLHFHELGPGRVTLRPCLLFILVCRVF